MNNYEKYPKNSFFLNSKKYHPNIKRIVWQYNQIRPNDIKTQSNSLRFIIFCNEIQFFLQKDDIRLNGTTKMNIFRFQ